MIRTTKPVPSRSAPDAGHVTRLPSGRTVTARTGPAHESVVIRSATGATELHVELTPSGPVLRFASARVELVAETLRMSCDRFELEATESLVERCGGSVERSADGDVRETIRGDLSTEARIVDVRARRGDVRIKANDDVRLQGERVKLNC